MINLDNFKNDPSEVSAAQNRRDLSWLCDPGNMYRPPTPWIDVDDRELDRILNKQIVKEVNNVSTCIIIC